MVHHPLTPSPSLLLTSHQLPLDNTLHCSATWPTSQPCPASTSLFQVRSRYPPRHILYEKRVLEFSTVAMGKCSFRLWRWGGGGGGGGGGGSLLGIQKACSKWSLHAHLCDSCCALSVSSLFSSTCKPKLRG